MLVCQCSKHTKSRCSHIGTDIFLQIKESPVGYHREKERKGREEEEFDEESRQDVGPQG